MSKHLHFFNGEENKDVIEGTMLDGFIAMQGRSITMADEVGAISTPQPYVIKMLIGSVGFAYTCLFGTESHAETYQRLKDSGIAEWWKKPCFCNYGNYIQLSGNYIYLYWGDNVSVTINKNSTAATGANISIFTIV